MKAKLWQIKTRHKNQSSFWGERDEITINARNIDEVIRKAKKNLMKGHEIYEIEWLATED